MLLICIVSAPLFAQDSGSPPSESISIFSRDNPIRIVYPVVMPPYTFEDKTGNAQGLAIDFLRLWSEKTGIPIRFTSAPWSEGLQMMRDGKADLHASLYYTEERNTYLDYVTIVASSAGSIFFHKNIINLSSPEDLSAYRVGAVRDSYHEQYVQEHLPKALLVSYPEFPEMLMAAQKGDIQVFIEDVGTTLYRLQERGLVDEFRHNPRRPLYRKNFWCAVRQGDTELTRALKQGMALITQEELAAIERKWLKASTIKTRDVLNIALYSDFAPFTFINAEGQPAGLFVDIWKLWAKKTGRKIEFRAGSWNDSLNSLKKGGADIHSGLFYSDARAQWFDYSQPFYETGSCFFYSSKQEKPYKHGVYAGKKIGVVKGSYNEEYLQIKHSTVDVIPFADMEKMLRAVLSGEISACLTEHSSMMALINHLGLSGMFDTEESIHFTRKFHKNR
jgi:ABC-type amino acid transport substrate-binding protein